MEHEQADLLIEAMPELPGLRSRAMAGDGEIAEGFALGGKGKYIGSVVFAKVFEIQAAELRIARDAAMELAAGGYTFLKDLSEGFEVFAMDPGVWGNTPESYKRVG